MTKKRSLKSMMTILALFLSFSVAKSKKNTQHIPEAMNHCLNRFLGLNILQTRLGMEHLVISTTHNLSKALQVRIFVQSDCGLIRCSRQTHHAIVRQHLLFFVGSVRSLNSLCHFDEFSSEFNLWCLLILCGTSHFLYPTVNLCSVDDRTVQLSSEHILKLLGPYELPNASSKGRPCARWCHWGLP